MCRQLPAGEPTDALGPLSVGIGRDAADAGVLRTRAIALMLQPGSERAGAAAYWQGIELLTDETARQYYRDVEVLLTPAEEADWRAADLEGRRMWFDRFWETRAATGGVTATERIAEHYRRLTTARSRYVRNSVRGTDSQGVLLAGEAPQRFPFDDRGVVFYTNMDSKKGRQLDANPRAAPSQCSQRSPSTSSRSTASYEA